MASGSGQSTPPIQLAMVESRAPIEPNQGRKSSSTTSKPDPEPFSQACRRTPTGNPQPDPGGDPGVRRHPGSTRRTPGDPGGSQGAMVPGRAGGIQGCQAAKSGAFRGTQARLWANRGYTPTCSGFDAFSEPFQSPANWQFNPSPETGPKRSKTPNKVADSRKQPVSSGLAVKSVALAV